MKIPHTQNGIPFAALKFSLALATLASLALTGFQPAIAETHTITDLGTLGGSNSFALGINNYGQVVGYAQNGQEYTLKVCTLGPKKKPVCYDVSYQEQRPFLWTPTKSNGTNGTMIDIGTLGGPYGIATAINSSGQIVGVANPRTVIKDSYSGSEHYESHAFLWTPSQTNGGSGSIIDLSLSGFDSYSGPPTLNDAGQVIGGENGNGFSLLWQNGMVTNLGISAVTINNRGQVVGDSVYTLQAALWQNGVITDLGVLPGDTGSGANGINTNGEVVGASSHGYDTARAFLFTIDPSGTVTSRTNLGTPPGFTTSVASRINNRGEVLGFAAYAMGQTNHSILWDRTNGMRDLTSLLADWGWALSQAQAINDAGQIVGTGVNPSGQTHAFLLTPLPAPRLALAATQPNGLFRFTLVGQAGSSYTIQASSNLVSWIAVTNFLSATGTNQFTDAAAPSISRRFYRAVNL